MYLHPALARALGEETRAEHLRRANRPAAPRLFPRVRVRRPAPGTPAAPAVPAVAAVPARDGPGAPAPAPAVRA